MWSIAGLGHKDVTRKGLPSSMTQHSTEGQSMYSQMSKPMRVFVWPGPE
jgi:hypothetical protein